MTASWKTVRVFISSTFRDMQAERDHLVRFVFPKLREELLKRRIHLVDVDLRWGVTSEQDALSVCREVVDECRPRFICMLGGRYGWMPPGKTRSITADEVHYGVLDRDLTSRGFAYFYFRDPAATAAMVEVAPGELREPAGSHGAVALAELKTAITEAGLRPFIYQAQWDNQSRRLICLKEFGDRVYADLKHSIDQEFGPTTGEKPDEFTEENAAMEAFIEERVQRFVLGSRQPVWNKLRHHAESTGGNGYLCLTGAAGGGKSALLGKFYQDYRAAHSQDLVIPHFVGASPGSTDVRRTLRRLCHELVTGAGLTTEIPEDPEKLRVAFAEILRQASTGKRVVILLDAIDQFDPTTQLAGWSWLLEELPATARIILSTPDGPTLESLRLRRHPPHLVELQPLNKQDREAIIREFLHRYRKSLTDDQRAELLAKADAGTPLYLLVALEELRTLGTYAEITDRIAQLPPDTRALFTWILKRLEEDDGFRDTSGRKIARELVSRFVSLLGASRHGLSQQELVELLSPGDPQGNVAALVRLLRPYLMQRGELLDFYHGQFREATEQEYLRTDAQRYDAHACLAAHFNHAERTGQPWNVAPTRKLTEFPYHLWQSGAKEPLFELGRDESFLSAQQEGLNEEPDLPFRTLRMALDAACGAENPVVMAEFTLAQAYGLSRQRTENPLDAILNPRLAPDVALQRAWGLADALDPQTRAYALLLLAWKLNTLHRGGEAGATLQKLGEKPLPNGGDYSPLLLLLFRRLESDFDISRWAAALLNESELKDLVRLLIRCNRFESAKRVASLVTEKSERTGLLVTMEAAELAQAGRIAEAVSVAGALEEKWDHASLLVTIAVTLVQVGRFADVTSLLDVMVRDIAVEEVTAGRLASVSSFVDVIQDIESRAVALRAIAGAQAEAGQFAEALSTAGAIRDAFYRASALCMIGSAQAQTGKDASPSFAAAISAASAIEQVIDRVNILSEIAGAQAEAGVEASSTFAEAKSIALTIEDAKCCAKALTLLVVALENAKRSAEASAVAARIAKEHRRDIVLIQTTGNFNMKASAGRLADVLPFVEAIKGAECRHRVLRAIAGAQAEAGQFAEALSTAGAIRDAFYRASALCMIGSAQAQTGKDASPSFAAAISAASAIEQVIDRVNILSEIAGAQAEAGVEASSTFAEAASLVNTIAKVEDRARPLHNIAVALAQAKRFAEAAATAGRIPEGECWRSDALLEIASVEARTGRISEALSYVSSIRRTQDRFKALSRIADAEARAGLEMDTLFGSAFSTAPATQDAASRAYAFKAIAGTQSQIGLAADSTFAEAISTAARIENIEERAKALRSIVDAQARTGTNVKPILDNAYSTAAAIEPCYWRDYAMKAIAAAQARAGLIREASATVAAIEDAKQRVGASWEICTTQIHANHFAEAVATAERIEEASRRVDAFRTIAVAQANAGVDARPIFARALSAAAAFGVGRPRVDAFCAIASALAEVGLDAAPAFEEACSAATPVKSTWGRGLLSPFLAKVQWLAETFASVSSVANSIGFEIEKWRNTPSESARWRSDDLSKIAGAQAQAGLDASPTFAKAISTAATIATDEAWIRADAFIEIAVAQANAGLDAASTFAKARCAALTGEFETLRDESICKVAGAQAQVGYIAEALSTAALITNAWKQAEALGRIATEQLNRAQFNEAVATARTITSTWERADVLREVACAQARAGHFVDAFTTAGAIEHAEKRFEPLREIAGAQAEAGQFAEALSTAGAIRDAFYRASALCMIGSAQAQTGKDASPSFAAAISAASAIEQVIDRVNILSEIAGAQAEAGVEAGATFARAISTAIAIEDVAQRANALREISIAQARSGDLNGALSTTDMISLEPARGLKRVGAALTKSTNQGMARAALRAYLLRASRFVESAWHSCGVVAQLYPNESTDLANFLIAFSRKLAS